MQPLEPPESHYVRAALGWLGLGDTAEAEKELAQVSPAFEGHPEVSEAHWLISARQERWEEALAAAERLLAAAPDRPDGWLHRAYALRRIPNGNIQRAWDALFPAADKFPREPIIPFNLACYACQMGRMDEARAWLKRAMDVGGKDAMKTMALADSDLQPLWDEIRTL